MELGKVGVDELVFVVLCDEEFVGELFFVGVVVGN